MTPTVEMPAPRAVSANQRASSAVATIGAIAQISASPAPPTAAIAASWAASTSSAARSARRPRTPSAGLSSAALRTYGSGLSAPASSSRMTTRVPANACAT